jgi:hypothetical protein
MSTGDVDGSEMDENHDMADATTEALISGLGRDADPVLCDLLGDVRTAYRSQAPVMSEALATFIAITPSPSPANRRTSRMRSLLTAKLAAIVATLLAGTGGLAVAGALPAPVQTAVSHAASHVGLNLPGHASPRAVEVTSNNPASGVVKPHSSDVNETPSSTPDNVKPPEPTDPPEACTPDAPDSPDTPTSVAPNPVAPTDPCPPVTPPANSNDGSGDQSQSGDQTQSGDNSGSQTQSGDQTQPGDNSGSQTKSGDQSTSGDNSGSQSGSDQSGSSSGGDQTPSTTVATGN